MIRVRGQLEVHVEFAGYINDAGEEGTRRSHEVVGQVVIVRRTRGAHSGPSLPSAGRAVDRRRGR